jgi:hypothetical protein
MAHGTIALQLPPVSPAGGCATIARENTVVIPSAESLLGKLKSRRSERVPN